MSWNPTVVPLYSGLPPGNISTNKYNSSYQQTYNYSNEFTFNNLLTYTSINVPQYVVYTDPSGSNNSVIVLCGGGTCLTYDPECSDAVRYWKTQRVNIYILLYRSPNMVNTLGLNVLNISSVYNLNALPFLLLYDLNTMFITVKTAYANGKIGLHGFSYGGGIVSSYSAIMSYNSTIMTDIDTIVNDTINDTTLAFPSMNFQKFINNYKSGSYLSSDTTSDISFVLLLYPYIDQTSPQQSFFYSTFNYLAAFTTIYTDTLSYLYSCKLYSDGNSDPTNNSGSMSMITTYYPPTYCVSTMTDPIVPVTINNIFFQNLLKNKVKNCYRQLYPKGGHGFGMGYCFNSSPTFPQSLYPYNFFEITTLDTVNINYGADFLNGNYINYNKSQWYNPVYNPSGIVSIDTSGVVVYQPQSTFNAFLLSINFV